MSVTSRTIATLVALLLPSLLHAAPKAADAWNVDDVQPGMKGVGYTVMKGTKLEEFQVEILGTLKNTSPGRDLILARFAGLGLERTGVIAGMSGSPVYIDGKLVGAVAYAWAYGKDPIGGITPFRQMHSFVEAYEKRDLAENKGPRRLSLKQPLRVGDSTYQSINVSDRIEASANPGEAWMVPLQTPIATSGFTSRSLKLFGDQVPDSGIMPVQNGAAGPMAEAQDAPLLPGSPLSIAMVTGDFDMSGIGTVTHIEGDRVYGWGHPFMSLGRCDLPMMTGYIHTVYPRQTVSFKMGSPLKQVGVINADVSTCIAGWLGREPDMLPVKTTVQLGSGATQTFNVKVIRHRTLMAPLVFTVLTNAVDMEGELPEELTAEMKVRVEIDGREPIIIQDTYSGSAYSGARAPAMLYTHVGNLINSLAYNGFEPVRITKIECNTIIQPGRTSAEIESVELERDVLAPGETLRANVFVRPHLGDPQAIKAELKLPKDLPEGTYTVSIVDDLTRARSDVRDQPTLYTPRSVDQQIQAFCMIAGGKRTVLALRVSLKASGVAIEGERLPKLPGSVVQMFSQSRRTGSQTIQSSISSQTPTQWVIQGSDSVTFTVNSKSR